VRDVKLGLVCVGGGRGERYGGDKLAETFAHRTVFEHSLSALRAPFPEAPLVAVCPARQVARWRHLLEASLPGVVVVAGGDRRQDSVRLGVERVSAAGAEVVAIHDAARPLVHPEDVLGAVEALGDSAGVVLCREVTDTIKEVDGNGVVVATIDRGRLRRAETPQVLRVQALRWAWRQLDPGREWTDEAAMLEEAGLTVGTLLARHPNPKLTAPGDLIAIRALSAARGDGCGNGGGR
jgi:2-C-methyl-D-erythritol 4-phosphate cytidylyltransferase